MFFSVLTRRMTAYMMLNVEFNVGKARLLMTFKDSADGKVRAAELEVKTGDNSQQPKQLHN